MALEDFVLPTEDVGLPGGGSFAVRGLGLHDITILLSQHGATMETFFQRYAGNTKANPLEVGMDLLNQAPALICNIVALAADRPQLIDIVSKLPPGVHLDALEKIAKLTFDAAGGPKKFLETVVRLWKGMSNLMPEQRPSKSGLQASGAK